MRASFSACNSSNIKLNRELASWENNGISWSFWHKSGSQKAAVGVCNRCSLHTSIKDCRFGRLHTQILSAGSNEPKRQSPWEALPFSFLMPLYDDLYDQTNWDLESVTGPPIRMMVDCRMESEIHQPCRSVMVIEIPWRSKPAGNEKEWSHVE